MTNLSQVWTGHSYYWTVHVYVPFLTTFCWIQMLLSSIQYSNEITNSKNNNKWNKIKQRQSSLSISPSAYAHENCLVIISLVITQLHQVLLNNAQNEYKYLIIIIIIIPWNHVEYDWYLGDRAIQGFQLFCKVADILLKAPDVNVFLAPY